MKEMFQGFLRDTEEEYKNLWESAIIVTDTNVLINLYKYTTKDTYKLFFDILKNLKESDRLFIPHQVALEYFFNYEKNMNLQHEAYKKLGNKIKSLIENVNKDIRLIKSENPFVKLDDFKFISEDLDELNKKVKEQLEKELDSLPDVKEIENNILELLEGIVGQSYDQEKIEEIQNWGEERFLNKVPPGWEDEKDPNKQGIRTYGSLSYQQKYGDLIMWHQMMDKAIYSSKPVIFITEEKKEDWWEKDNKAIKRPQPHLIQEFFDKTGQKYNMFRIERFVEQAKNYLNITVTEEQLDALTNQVEIIRKNTDKQSEESDSKRHLNINNFLNYLSENEHNTFTSMLETSYDVEQDASKANYSYNRAIEWAINIVATKMHNKASELIYRLGYYNSGLASDIKNNFESLPEDKPQRLSKLLDLITIAKREIAYYEDQGY